MLQLLSLVAQILIVLRLLPPIPHNLNSLINMQTEFHFQKLQRPLLLIR
jgi:hypothetical protein